MLTTQAASIVHKSSEMGGEVGYGEYCMLIMLIIGILQKNKIFV